MKDEDKTKAQLLAELQELRQRVNQLKQAEISWQTTEKALRLSEENRKTSEKKLTRSLAELNAVINALPGIVSVVDTDFNVLVANDEVYKKFGQGGLKEIIGKKCHMTRKGLAYPCPHCNLVETFKTGKPVSRLSTFEEEDLMGIATKAYAIPLKDENGATWGGVEVIMDITDIRRAQEDLRKSEEKYRALINGMHDTVWVIDFDGSIIDTNQAAVEILGYSRKELSSMHIADIDPNIGDGTRKLNNKKKLSDKIKIIETIHTTKNGNQIPVEIQCTAFNYQGKDATLCIARDITKRKRAEEELLRLRKLDSVGVLAGGIAHDFNNLLTAIFGNIEMGKMLLSSQHKAYDFLEHAEQSLETATKLTTQLLTFAKGGDPIKETLSTGEALTEVAQFSLQGSNAKLETNISPDLWPIEADKGQLSHAISNIIINAQQAMSAGGTIKLGAKNIERLNKKYIKITIEDKGPGIAPQHLERIFDPYFTTKQKGSGLGLATTHSIITKHGGTIFVDSSVNRGTKFTIQFPAAKISAKTISPSSLNLDQHGPVSSLHILVVDDEETIRDLLGAMLKRMGYKVAFAVNGIEGIANYRKAFQIRPCYDIVIMDLTIPGDMGGETAAQEILKIDPKAKLIVSSGYTTDPVMANYQDYGFQGILAKPYRFSELKKAIEQVLKN
jgi:two-component system cell cycle sensor histidine kinase/response regulator CckA